MSNKKFYRILWNITFLVVIGILIFLSNRERNWFDIFTGFVCGMSLWEIVYLLRDVQREKKKLR